MTALRMTVCLVSLVGVSGFSSAPIAPCDQVAASYAALNEKVGTCTQAGAVLPFDAASCRQATGGCTGEDRATIAAFLSCVDRLPSCGDESGFRDQLEGCAAGARLSPECSL